MRAAPLSPALREGGVQPLATQLEEESAGIVVEHVSKRFGGIFALRDVSFRVAQGSIFGMIGPNGSGKTTLLNTINGVYRATTGVIRVEGREVQNLSPSALLRLGVARTFQNPHVFLTLTVQENMMLPTIETGRLDVGFRDEILQTLHLDGLAKATASQLSGGEQKLLEFARAMITRPRVVLMDEPFGGVDAAIKTVMQDNIRRWSSEAGTTFMVVSHEIPDLVQLANRVVCLAEGSMIADGTPSEVTADEHVVSVYLGRRYERKD